MDWHRLFGLVLTDFFTGSPYTVELEKALSIKQQFLDVVIVRKHPGVFAGELPDGLENLSDHNLISFKSHREPFNSWTLDELMGHYVNYRKQVSESMNDLIPEEKFRLYGVCARFPTQLSSQIDLKEVRSGVYEVKWGVITIRIVVLRKLAEEEKNAPLHLFSAEPKQIQFGRLHYRQHNPETSTLIQRMLIDYQTEGIAMPYTMEDFRRDLKKEVVAELTLAERLEGVPTEDVLNALPTEQIEKYLQKKKEKPTNPPSNPNQ